MQDSFHIKLQQCFEDFRDEPKERLRVGPATVSILIHSMTYIVTPLQAKIMYVWQLFALSDYNGDLVGSTYVL